MNVGKTIEKLRKAQGLTQDEFAEKLNKLTGSQFRRTTISNYENGTSNPQLAHIPHIAKILGVSIDYLFTLNLHVLDDVRPDIRPDAISKVQRYALAVVEEPQLGSELDRLRAEVIRLKAANEALLMAFREVGAGKAAGSDDVGHKKQKIA